MPSKVEKQIFRLYMLTHNVCLPVVRAYLTSTSHYTQECNNDLPKFLEKYKHEFYHMLFGNIRCCQCGGTPIKPYRVFRKQYEKLYSLGTPKRHDVSKSSGTGKLYCCCSVKVNSNCTTKDLDLSTIHVLLKVCVQNIPTCHEMWLDKIIQQRNKLCHLSNLNDITESYTQTMWSYIEGSCIGLASDIPPIPSYKESIENQIELMKRIDFEQDDVTPIVDSLKDEIADLPNVRF